ncbi:hypothetical protein VMCG_04952 [Cytospora schulzeri]|uniref:Rhodopsin domain-containing protein n=1 Tax=Cytospora schulzeri TaxID=448051 RepID=A0A423WM21_9PEZI|nr:hypothetical protein VMCG_04952 [Valsa malicola]
MAPNLAQQAIQADLYGIIGRAAVLGVLFHVSIQAVEFEKFMFHYLATLPVGFVLMSTVLATYGPCGWLEAVGKSCLFEFVFNGTCLLSISIYRVLFHRCRSFPGPLGVKISRFRTACIAAKNVQYYKELDKFHSMYGDFVRTGPREITIFRASAVPTIYGPSSKCLKSTWRKAWERGMAIKALATYQPRIETKARLLSKKIQERAGQIINMTDWSMFFSFDVMGDVGFSKDFGNLTTGVEHSAIKPIHEHIKILGILSPIPWLMNLLGSIPGAAKTYTEMFTICANEIRAKQKAVHEKDVSAAPSIEALDDDARIVLLAGSDTTASTFTNSLYHLVKYPETQTRMRELIRQALAGGPQDWDYEKVKGVKYIDEFISETLRLRPAVLVAGSRETPAGGIQIDEVHIPGNTNVLVPIYQIHRDPRYWKKAEEFIPERWGERRVELGTEKAPYFPFLSGAYTCPGKNVANMSLRIALAMLVQKFDISFAPGEDGEALKPALWDVEATNNMGWRDELIGVVILFCVLNTLTVGLRIFVRTTVTRGALGWDDVALVITYYNIAMLDVCYIISGIVKISVALVLYRLDPRRLIRFTLVADIIICLTWTIVATLVLSLGCTELSAYTFSSSVCRNTKYSQEASYVIFDLFHVLLPIVILWNVQISRAQKWSIVGLFGVGLLAAVAAIMKLQVYVEVYHSTATTDHVALWYRGVIWAFAEHGLSLFASSILALRPLAKYISKGWLTLTTTLYGSSKSRNSSAPGTQSWLSRDSDRSKKPESAEMNTIGVRNDVSVYSEYNLGLVNFDFTLNTYLEKNPIDSGYPEFEEHIVSMARSLSPLGPKAMTQERPEAWMESQEVTFRTLKRPFGMISIATITGLQLYSLRVEASFDESVAIVSEDSLLRFVNKETSYNPLTIVDLQIAEGKASGFSTCNRRWEDPKDLLVFQGCNPAGSEGEIISETTFRHNPEDVYRQADAESISSDDSDSPLRDPPCWTWGKFFHKNDVGDIYFWQVEPGHPKVGSECPQVKPKYSEGWDEYSGSWRTHVWKLTRRDGEVVYVTSVRHSEDAHVMEPPEEWFEDWDSSEGDKIEPTHHAVSQVQLLQESAPDESIDFYSCTKSLVGPGRYVEFWNHIRAQEPPEGAIKHLPKEDPYRLRHKYYVGDYSLIEYKDSKCEQMAYMIIREEPYHEW